MYFIKNNNRMILKLFIISLIFVCMSEGNNKNIYKNIIIF